ncbi:MAG: inositol monophosphatase, partial [candidate division KSB1 bacterium]|nr:inositol monophosphatase [candidate division KSB1 bacterium]
KIILGVVYDPFRDEMYSAERGKGAYCNNKPIHVSHLNQINRCLIATGFPFRCKELLDEYWKVLSAIFMAVSGIRRTGSAALDLAYVACGRFDGFWELRLSPWDIAAGSLLIEEAGGKISDFEGEDNHIWVGDVVASNGMIHDFILSEVKKVFPLNP